MMRGLNMKCMMKQMQKVQKQMQKDQEELHSTIFEGLASDDAVVVKFTGAHKMTDIAIKDEAVDPDDVDMLQDLVIMAVNDAMAMIDDQTQKTMGKYSRNMPGF